MRFVHEGADGSFRARTKEGARTSRLRVSTATRKPHDSEAIDPHSRVVIPAHSQFRLGTLRQILHEAGLTVEQLKALL